jgi:hypothetical protein
VIVHEQEGLAGTELIEGLENQRVPSVRRDLPDINNRLTGIATARQFVSLGGWPSSSRPRSVMRSGCHGGSQTKLTSIRGQS